MNTLWARGRRRGCFAGRLSADTVQLVGLRRIVGLLVAAGTVALTTAPAMAHAQRHDPKHGAGRGTSTNWSGYAIDGTNATDVVGSWTQPTAFCSAGETSWSSPWVGIDGDNSSTVEQIGTDSDCQNGSPVYYAWYEMYPKSLVTIPITVSPNESFTGEVTYTGSGSYTLTLSDSAGDHFTTVQSSTKARRSSVEWIEEGPSSGSLTDFGSVPFASASATISGQAGPLVSFGTAAVPITMVTKKGLVRAVPGPVSSKSAFTVTWEHS